MDVLRASSANARRLLKLWRPGPIDFDNASEQLPIPPYVLGAWIGDGDTTHPIVSKPNCRMVEEWVAWCESRGSTVHQIEKRPDKCERWSARGGDARAALVQAGVNKHVPHRYLTSSIEERLELLAGLLDSDGHYGYSNHFDWISVSQKLAEQFAFLSRSLGFACYVSECTKGIRSRGFVGTYWRCSLSGDLDRIPTRDKRAHARRQKKNHLMTGFSIEPVGEGRFCGFTLDGDGLFLLGDFTVTHNTICATHLIQECIGKGKRALFVADRISLVDQTSAVLDAEGIAHGVLMGAHWRHRPWERVQVASAQTLQRRGWPEADLRIIDECHSQYKTVIDEIDRRDVVTIGLSATPFTRGLGKHYDRVVSVTTTNELIAQGYLAPFRIFAASEPDMTGAKTVAGEWSDDVAAERSMPIVGDCVAEYLKHGDGKKAICFGCTVAHCEELQRQFLAAGVQAAVYCYHTGDEERKRMLAEYRKPDSFLRVLISVAALARGFDVPNVHVVILARPLRKSLAEHIQMFGRGLRRDPEDPDKVCIVLDHSGNTERLWGPMQEFFAHGISELDDGAPKKKQAAENKAPEPRKCPSCKHLHQPRPTCPNCGFEYPKKAVRHVAGELIELGAHATGTVLHELSERFLAELLHIARNRGYKDGWAIHKHRERFGVWPSRQLPDPIEPTGATLSWVRSRMIAYAKATGIGGRSKAARRR